MRLIDADALKESLEPMTCGKARNQSYRDGLNDGLHDFFPQIINKAPTIEPPVVHGRWIQHMEPDLDWVKYEQECSACGKRAKGTHGTDYCPSCGARMDGDTHD